MKNQLKKTFFILCIVFWYSIGNSFALEIHIPTDRVWDDIATRIENKNSKEKRWSLTQGQWSTTVSGNRDTLFNFINLINEYLRWIFGAIATGLTIYAWYEAIIAWWDHKVLKKAMRILIGTAVWLAIAMLSTAFIKILVNLV